MASRDLLDVLYPRCCAGCGSPGPGASAHLCWDCMAELLVIQPPFCSVCGEPVSGFIDHAYVCSQCASSAPSFDRARAAGRYEGVLREMVCRFKYNGALWLAGDLAAILRACAAAHFEEENIDAIAFVPLYPGRQRERGYNQAQILAHALSRAMHKPLLSRCLRRARRTRTQTNLTAPQRATNVKDAFRPCWCRWLEGRRVLLVDDVMTTGATVNECAKALKSGGAAEVSVVTLARG